MFGQPIEMECITKYMSQLAMNLLFLKPACLQAGFVRIVMTSAVRLH
jgi:hypothetical protein